MLGFILVLQAHASIIHEIEQKTLPKLKFELVDILDEDSNFYLATSNDSGYKCSIPDGATRKTKAKKITEAEVNEILAVYKGNSHLLDRGEWWTYELEVGKWFRQFHFDRPGLMKKEDDPVPTNFILGKWNTTIPTSTKLPVFDSNQSFSVTLFNGDICGPEKLPRETTLDFFCDKKTMVSYLIDIIETSTCKYRVRMHLPELCATEHIEDAVVQCYYKHS
mmetsp:Transcript_16039/g.29392  ORF Transcript_16039/g.29392 Transcript_16039/m.29392 type:complete len:221 (-) Transcript_16039:179-841(-)